MKYGPEQIERIVQEVVQRMRGLSAGGAFAAGSEQQRLEPESHAQEQEDPSTGVLTIGAHVVTLAELDGRLQGLRQVVIGPGAIVTPAVRDELTRHGIQIKRMAAEQTTTGTTRARGRQFSQRLDRHINQPGLVIAACQSGSARQEWLHGLEQRGMTWRSLVNPCLISLIEQIIPLVEDEKELAVVVTDRVAPALCLANRHAGIRAILARSEKTIQDDARGVGANLMVLSPNGRSSYQMQRLILAFQRQGPWRCPEEYQNILG